MPKFGRALAVQLVSALVLVFAVLFAANHFLLDKVYLAGKKQELGDLTRETPPEDRQALASSRGWVLAEVPFQRDEEALNGDLGVRLVRAGMPLNRFWLTSETIGALGRGQTVQKIWNQDSMNMSFLMRAFVEGDRLVVAGTALAHTREITSVADRFLAVGLVLALGLMAVLVWTFVRARVGPLRRLMDQAGALTRLEFPVIDLDSGDEIGDLARQMNAMARSLEAVHARSQDRNRDLETLVVQLGHELKTPLAVLKSHLAALEEGLELPDRWQTMETQVGRIDRLVTQTLALTRADRADLALRSFDLGDLVRRVHNVLGTQSSARIRIESGPGTGLDVFGDPGALETVLTNLLGNALAHGTGEEAEIRLVSGPGTVVCTVANRTAGTLTDADLTQFGRPLAPLSRGRTGLGLYLVKTLLDRMGVPWSFRLVGTDRLEAEFTLPRAPVTLASPSGPILGP